MKVIYRIVQHGDGWAYKVGDVFSETFPTRDEAKRTADRAAREQRISGKTVGIEYETADGQWHEELISGEDRPDTEVRDESD